MTDHPIKLDNVMAFQGAMSDLQTALTCLDDIVTAHPYPCQPFSDADLRCTESWIHIDNGGRCTHRVAYELLVKHEIRRGDMDSAGDGGDNG